MVGRGNRGNPGERLKPLPALPSAARDARPESFSDAAPAALANAQVRANIRHATGSIRAKRAAVVAEVPDWEPLREIGRASCRERVSDTV